MSGIKREDIARLLQMGKDAYQNGAGDIEVCDLLEITKKEFNDMFDNIPAFRRMVERGRVAMEAWWMREGRMNLKNKEFQNSLWSFNMKNRFGWSEKSETKNQDVPFDQLTEDEIRQKLEAYAPQLLRIINPDIKTDAQLLEYMNRREDQ